MDEVSATTATPIDASLLEKLLSNQLSEADARRFVSGDPEWTGIAHEKLTVDRS